MKTHIVITICGLLSLVACRHSETASVRDMTPERDPYRYETSLIQLLATPDTFHGKKVQVRGVYFSGFEASFVAPSRELAEGVANCIWIDFSGSLEKIEREPLSSGEWVTLIGTFDAKSHGHMDRFAATIRDIEGFQYRSSWVESEMKKEPNQQE